MRNPLRVLIVEDTQDDAVLLLRELRHGGYEVVSERVETAQDMNAALDRAEWDIVLSDYTMPQFSARMRSPCSRAGNSISPSSSFPAPLAKRPP